MIPLLLADENFDFPVVAELKNLGYDIVTLVDLNLANRSLPDGEVLQIAVQLDRALITINRRDFIRLHRLDDNHAGIVVCTRNADVTEFANSVHQALRDITDFRKRLIRVYRPS